MSTEMTGDSEDVFHGLRDAFEQLAEKHDIVLVCKVSNACPASIPCGEEDEILGPFKARDMEPPEQKPTSS